MLQKKLLLYTFFHVARMVCIKALLSLRTIDNTNYAVNVNQIVRHLQFQELEDSCLCMILPFFLVQLFRFSSSQIQLDKLNSKENKQTNNKIKNMYETKNLIFGMTIRLNHTS